MVQRDSKQPPSCFSLQWTHTHTLKDQQNYKYRCAFQRKKIYCLKTFYTYKSSCSLLHCIHYCLKDCKLFWCESLNTQYKEPKILPRSPVNSSHSEVIWTTPTEVLGVIPVFVVLGVLYHSTTVTPTKGPRDGKEGPTDQLLPTISYHRHTNSPRAWFAILTSFNIYHRLLFLR